MWWEAYMGWHGCVHEVLSVILGGPGESARGEYFKGNLHVGRVEVPYL